ncbi:MAG TPA: BACON domain-containing protein [Candidatus Coprenecus stercoravium]|uniref:BACON domain-containing protein n=1 Tax=Candidatus Coprenecus stercoravium TaxID=2840735 RepID=A0A9D2GSJ3_9BACT|nr:BACON domain-containing protein [Candidatus Coprenecus stercoravium]
MIKSIYTSAAVILLSLAALTISSCREENEKTGLTDNSIILPDNLAPVFSAAGGTVNINFTSTASWTAETDQQWCGVSPEEGDAGNNIILTLTAAENPEYDERNATLILRSGNCEKRVTLTQKQKSALTVSSNKIEVGQKGGPISIEAEHNYSLEYSIEESASGWITPVRTKGMETTTLSFTVDENDSGDKREGRIILTSGDNTETVTVYQETEPSLVLTKDEYTVGSAGETVTIQLRSNVPYEMTMPSGADWLKENNTRTSSTYTRYITVAANDTYSQRSAEIIFSSPDYGLADTVTITQLQNNAIVVAESMYTIAAEGGALTFPVNTNVSFSTSIPQGCTWIKQAASTKALEEKEISLTISQNTDPYSREAEVTFSFEDIKQTVTIRQYGTQTSGVFRLTHENTALTIPYITGGSFSSGTIDWGDNSSEQYATGLSHIYSSRGSHTVTVLCQGAETISIEGLVGITDLDLTSF